MSRLLFGLMQRRMVHEDGQLNRQGIRRSELGMDSKILTVEFLRV